MGMYAAAAEIQRVTATRQEEVNQLQAELQRAQAAATDRDEIQKVIGKIGNRTRGADGRHVGVPAYSDNGEDSRERDGDNSEMSTIDGGFSQPGSITGIPDPFY